MGCGGSKQDVASGNTVSHRGLLRKKSTGATRVKGSSTSAGAPANASGNLAASPRAGGTDVKDITVNTEGRAAAGGAEGALAHSPDRYFSSRKDDESVDAAAGGEYFSPRYVPDDGEGAVAKALEELGVGGALGGAAVREGNEKPSATASVDLKEPILVEERKLEMTIIEKKSLGTGEIVSEASTQ